MPVAMSAIITSKCCCDEKVPFYLYEATKCVTYSQNPCITACGNCCSGDEPPTTIKFCDWYLQKIGFTLPFSALYCYFVEYQGCAYLINQTPLSVCPLTPPAGVYNEGSYLEVKLKGVNPCCPAAGPSGECTPDIIVEDFPYSDPWGIQNPVTVSSTLGLCVFKPGSGSELCHRPGEFLQDSWNLVNVDTSQQVGKCFERANADSYPPTICSAAGITYLKKNDTIQQTEDFDPCDCSGDPGFANYERTFLKCYGAGECGGWYCPGFCPEGDPTADADYADCVANRFDCTADIDPLDSYTVSTLYKIIKSYVTYPCGEEGPLPPCECAYYSADAIRISFPLCYATAAGYDPTDPADDAAIEALYMAKVETFDPCDEECLVNVGPLFGGIQSVSCIKICGASGYKLQIFSGGAGDIAQYINDKLNPDISAASLNQWFWFGYRQGIGACGGDPNERPPYGPGDLMAVDRAEINTANWRCYVYIKGYSPRFRYCATQSVAAPSGSTSVNGVSVCMSTNAVSPAEWAAGTRPSMAAVRNDCYYDPTLCPDQFVCEKPAGFVKTDCTAVGTYPQVGTLVGTVYTPGYTSDFGDPCGTGWLDLNCKLWACASEGCSCANCEAGNCPPPCCNCGFGVPGPPGCTDHSLKCSIPSNATLTIT